MLINREKKNIAATIVADSVNPNGQRLTSFILNYPRFIHSELMTHRMLSRNAASSRAIPVARMIENLKSHGAHPEFWGAEQRGMAAADQLEGEPLSEVKKIWNGAKLRAINAAEVLMERGLHKQISNRVLEPWQPYTALVSATDWPHFFNLRAHPAAQPEFQVLAYQMLEAYLESTPNQSAWGDWHIPFGERMDPAWDMETRLRVATARAARISYETYDGEFSLEKDLELYDRIMVSEPLHASPAEHPAQAVPNLWMHSDYNPVGRDAYISDLRGMGYANTWALPYDINMVHQGNYCGWTQHRKMQPREHVTQVDLAAVLAKKPAWIDAVATA